MPTLLLASRAAAYDRALAQAAEINGWAVTTAADKAPDVPSPPAVVYVTTEVAMGLASRLRLSLLEPPLELLTRVPIGFRRREVAFARFGDLTRLQARTFVKPADPLDKFFDPGLYLDVRDIRARGGDRSRSPVLLSEPVEWTAEFRCFVLDGKFVTGSPYLSFGRPCWKHFADKRCDNVPRAAQNLVTELCRAMKDRLPPAFVIDVGMIENRGWAVVEFNPVWCAGLLGADPAAVLPILKRATRPTETINEADRRWVVARVR